MLAHICNPSTQRLRQEVGKLESSLGQGMLASASGGESIVTALQIGRVRFQAGRDPSNKSYSVCLKQGLTP
jgi:hypothetical protein